MISDGDVVTVMLTGVSGRVESVSGPPPLLYRLTVRPGEGLDVYGWQIRPASTREVEAWHASQAIACERSNLRRDSDALLDQSARDAENI